MSSFIPKYFPKPKEFVGRQTDHRLWDHGSPGGFMCRIWRPGDHISAALLKVINPDCWSYRIMVISEIKLVHHVLLHPIYKINTYGYTCNGAK